MPHRDASWFQADRLYQNTLYGVGVDYKFLAINSAGLAVMERVSKEQFITTKPPLPDYLPVANPDEWVEVAKPVRKYFKVYPNGPLLHAHGSYLAQKKIWDSYEFVFDGKSKLDFSKFPDNCRPPEAGRARYARHQLDLQEFGEFRSAREMDGALCGITYKWVAVADDGRCIIENQSNGNLQFVDDPSEFYTVAKPIFFRRTIVYTKDGKCIMHNQLGPNAPSEEVLNNAITAFDVTWWSNGQLEITRTKIGHP